MRRSGFSFCLDDRDPLLRGLDHVLDLDALVEHHGEVLAEPGRGEAEDGDLHAAAGHDLVRREVGFLRLLVYEVGGYEAADQLLVHLVVHRVTGLDVVVADADRVVADDVHHLGEDAQLLVFDEVVVVDDGLALEIVSAVEEEDLGTRLRALGPDEGDGLREVGGLGLVGLEVVREEGAVRVRGLDDGEDDGRFGVLGRGAGDA